MAKAIAMTFRPMGTYRNICASRVWKGKRAI